ncbi:MAG TPA: heavy metal-binding domain-containing protein [Bryobacteraceae bacterium]|nr:heavy metal-binding domain-containing protein [Bryobacteraceae bacterium]
MASRTRLGAALALLLFTSAGAWPQGAPPVDPKAEPQPAPVEFSCPMDPEVRSKTPGKCPRCGMTLVANIPEPIEYPAKFTFSPPQIPAGEKLHLEIRVANPATGARVKHFQIIHEKPLHLFVVSEDLAYFSHEHPELGDDGVFRLDTLLPKRGTYKFSADFLPEGGSAQFISDVVTTAGYKRSLAEAMVTPDADLAPKHAENLDVSLTVDPAQPLAGKKTMLFFTLQPAEGLELYLGAWGHLLAASNDLVDTIHTHPIYVTDPKPGEKQVQFNIFFPREAIYRIWVQFQREGKVNTVSFTIPVSSLK